MDEFVRRYTLLDSDERVVLLALAIHYMGVVARGYFPTEPEPPPDAHAQIVAPLMACSEVVHRAVSELLDQKLRRGHYEPYVFASRLSTAAGVGEGVSKGLEWALAEAFKDYDSSSL